MHTHTLTHVHTRTQFKFTLSHAIFLICLNFTIGSYKVGQGKCYEPIFLDEEPKEGELFTQSHTLQN